MNQLAREASTMLKHFDKEHPTTDRSGGLNRLETERDLPLQQDQNNERRIGSLVSQSMLRNELVQMSQELSKVREEHKRMQMAFDNYCGQQDL